MLEEFRTQKITWDRANSRLFEQVNAVEGDENGRRLEVQIVNGGTVENLSGVSLALAWRNNNLTGLEPFEIVNADEGVFELYYPTGMLKNVGKLKASLVLFDNGGKLESREFEIHIRRSVLDSEAVESSNEFTALTEALVKINDLEANYAPRLNEVTAQLAQTQSQKADITYVEQMASSLGELKVSGVYETFSELETDLPDGNNGVYIVTADGHWYYWNGTLWVDGGLFQSNQWLNALTTQNADWKVE